MTSPTRPSRPPVCVCGQPVLLHYDTGGRRLECRRVLSLARALAQVKRAHTRLLRRLLELQELS